MIFKLQWYNKDSYGPTDSVTALVQADTEIEAKEHFIKQFKFLRPYFDLSFRYKMFKAENITNEKLLWFDHSTI